MGGGGDGRTLRRLIIAISVLSRIIGFFLISEDTKVII